MWTNSKDVVAPLCLITILIGQAAAEDVKEQVVFTGGQQGYHTYWIPALMVTRRGTLLAFCEGRKTGAGDHGDIDLMLKRSTDRGATWGPLELVHEEGGDAKITIGNPCPVIDESTGTIWLTLCRDNDDVLLMHSADDAQSWSKPADITRDVDKSDWSWVATGPGVGIQLRRGPHAGRMVIPCDHGVAIDGKRVMFSHVFYSDNHGQSWQLGGTLDRHTDECQVVELSDGRLMLNMRNYWGRAGGRADRGGMRAVAFSEDGGDSWSDLSFDKTLIEPVCQASLIGWHDQEDSAQTRILFSNPASQTQRHRLTVRSSSDGGKTWPFSKVLNEGSSSYSSLAQLDDGSIGCLYESGYGRIVFARFQLEWLENREN